MKGQKIEIQQKAHAQLAATHAILASAEVVDLAHAAAGTTGIRNEHQLHRHLETAKCAVIDRTYSWEINAVGAVCDCL